MATLLTVFTLLVLFVGRIHAVSVIQMLTRSPCELELGNNANGRYYRAISEQFPPGVVRSQTSDLGQAPNLQCSCTSRTWMVCIIRVLQGTIEERLVKFKLDRRNPMRLRPFVLMQFPGRIYPPIVYTHPACRPQVHAEIIVITEGPGEPITPPLSRSNSGPSAFHHPNRYIPLSTCDGGSPDSVCPIQLTPFAPGDPVYVLKSQEDTMKKGNHVPCISAAGLRKWASTDKARREGGFKDPLKREGERILTIKDDYVVYVVHNDSEVIYPGRQSENDKEKATPSSGGSSSAEDANRPAPTNDGGSTSADDAARPPPNDGLPPPFTLRELDAALPGIDAGSPQEDLLPLPLTRSHSDPGSGSPDIDPAGSDEPQPPSEPGPSNQPPPRRSFFGKGKGKKLSASRTSNPIFTYIITIFTFFVFILFFTFRKSFPNDDLYVEFIHNDTMSAF